MPLLECCALFPSYLHHPRLSFNSQGFDEYMNIVLEETDELDMKRRTKKPLGKILLKGDNITCVMQAPA